MAHTERKKTVTMCTLRLKVQRFCCCSAFLLLLFDLSVAAKMCARTQCTRVFFIYELNATHRGSTHVTVDLYFVCLSFIPFFLYRFVHVCLFAAVCECRLPVRMRTMDRMLTLLASPCLFWPQNL